VRAVRLQTSRWIPYRRNSLDRTRVRQTRSWPPQDTFDSFIGLLDQSIAEETNLAKRTKLSAVRDAAADVGKGALGGLLATLVRHAAGI
jgi:hypothetical protein